MSNDVYREALKKLIEVRSRDRVRRSSRRIEDSVKIGKLAKLLFNELFEVIRWDQEERVLKMK